MTSETKNIEELKTHLEQDETIESYVLGVYECIIMGNETLRDGIFAVTNKRLIFYAKINLSYDMKVFPYSSILNIETSRDFMGHMISFFTTDNRLKLKWINSKNINEFISIIKERIGINVEFTVS